MSLLGQKINVGDDWNTFHWVQNYLHGGSQLQMWAAEKEKKTDYMLHLVWIIHTGHLENLGKPFILHNWLKQI